MSSCTYKPAENPSKKLEKSRCCQSGCDDCPWGFKIDPEAPQEFLVSNSSEGQNEEIDLDQLDAYLEDEELNPPNPAN